MNDVHQDAAASKPGGKLSWILGVILLFCSVGMLGQGAVIAGILTALAGFIILPPTRDYVRKNNNPSKRPINDRDISIIAGVLVVIAFVAVPNGETPSENTTVAENPTKQEQVVVTNEPEPKTEEPKVEKQPEAMPVNPIEHISAVIKKQYPDYEVTVWNLDGSYADPGTEPWEVIINSPIGSVSSCQVAKEVAYYSMKNLYTDDVVKDKIDRVLINATPQVRASLGATDGRALTKEMWDSNGPTNTAKALQATGSSEDETKPHSSRTFWEPLGSGNCK